MQYLKFSILLLILSSVLSVASELHTLNNKDKNTTQVPELLAVVNGHEIKLSDFHKAFYGIPLKTKKKLLKKVIASELLVEYAEKEAVYNDPKVIEEIEKTAKKRKEKGRKFTDLDKRMVHGLYVVNLQATEYAEKAVDDQMIKSYYETRKRNMKRMSYVKIYEITVNTKKDAEAIEKALKETKDAKYTFVELIKKYNMSQSKKQLAKPRKIYKFGQYNNEYNKALFSLKKGEFTKHPIHQKDGYHFLYCVEAGKSRSVPKLEELHDNIRNVLIRREANDWIKKKVMFLKVDANITNYLEKVKSNK